MHRKGEFPMRYQAAIFDMDGTILNTVKDLTSSLNYALLKTGHRSDFVPDDVRLFFGSGVFVAARRALWCERTGKILRSFWTSRRMRRSRRRRTGSRMCSAATTWTTARRRPVPIRGSLRSSESSGRQDFPPPSSPTNRTMRSKSLRTTTSRDFLTLPSGRCRGCAKSQPPTPSGRSAAPFTRILQTPSTSARGLGLPLPGLSCRTSSPCHRLQRRGA